MTATAVTGPGWRDARAHAHWPAVRVDVAEIMPAGSACHVRSVVHLGALLPVDVHVELASAASCPVVAHELWSGCAYGNGSYVYERTLPSAALQAHDAWTVRVRPALATLGGAAAWTAPRVARAAVARAPLR